MRKFFKRPFSYMNAVFVLLVIALAAGMFIGALNPLLVKRALAALNVITDGGTSGKLTVFAAGTNNRIGDSIIQDNGINIGVGMPAPIRGNPDIQGQTDRDGTIFAAGHIAAANAVNAGTTMGAQDFCKFNGRTIFGCMSSLFSPRFAGSCELYYPPTAGASLRAVTLCWGAAQRINDTTPPNCAIGRGRTVFNADDHVGAGETTQEGTILSDICDASGLCHIALYACIVQ